MSNVRSISTPSPVAALLAIALLAAPTPAPIEQQFDQCAGEGDAAPALRIDACSALIASNALNPTNLAAAYDNRGNAYAAEHDFDDATAFVNLGLAYAGNGTYDRAVVAYDRALALRPNDTAILDSRGLAYAKLGQFDHAVADYDAALKLAPSAAIFFDRGNAYAGESQYDRAIADYNAALKLEPNSATVLNNRGLARAAKGQYD